MILPRQVHHFLSLSLFCALLCAFFTGCGFGPTLYPTEGTVKADEQPLPKGSVTLFPDKDKGNKFNGTPTGEVVDGKFKIMTQGSAGAPAGWYKVTVTGVDSPDSTKPNAVVNPVDARFREMAKTPLEFEVVASPAAGAYDLKVSSK